MKYPTMRFVFDRKKVATKTTDNDTDKYSKECGICGRDQRYTA